MNHPGDKYFQLAPDQLSEGDKLKLIQELQKQVDELKIQNKELKKREQQAAKEIASRKKTEEELRKFRAISDHANFGAAISSLEGNFLYVNDFLAQMLGWEVSELLGKHYRVVHSEDQSSRLDELVVLMKEKKGFTSIELHHTRKDGSTFPTLMSAKVMYDEKNQPIYLSTTVIDISTIKQTEDQLRKSEEKYRNIFESVQDVYFEASMGGILLEVSPSIEVLTKGQYRRHEMIGKSFTEVYSSPDHRNTYFSKLFSQGSLSDYELLLRNIDGLIIPVAVSAVLLYDSDGKPEKITGILRDITERKKAEETLKQSEAALNNSQEIAKMGSWELDLRSNKVTCSRNYYTLIGRQPDGNELSVDEFNNIVYPDDKHLLDEKLQEMYRTREVSSLDFRLIMPDGQIKWVQNNIVPEFDGEILVALRGVNIDITDKKLAEKEILDLNSSLENKVAERTKEVREINDRLEKDIAERMRVEEELLWNQTLLQLMAESSPLGFLVVDNRTDKILYFNHRFCQIWEIQNIEDQMHRGELKNNDIIPYCLPVLADISAFAESCKPLQSEENRISIEDEIAFTENRTIRRFSTQIRGEKDEYYGRFYIFEDITGQKRTQEDIIRSRDSAEKANHAKSEFLSRMSHELRTPMNSILGFAQLLEFSELGPRQMKGVKHILNSGKLLLNLINEVLDISRIESGRLTLSPEPVHLKGVIEEVLDTVQPLANEREIRLELTDTSSNQLFIISDRKRLKQVLLNLLNNAVKYNRQGGTILVNTESKPTNTAGSFNVRISVTDTGFGIHSDDIPKLFVPFERIGADQSNTEGTGLGLAIVKRIVNAMEGTFGVESVVGEGSTFWIELPQTENQVNSRNRKDDFRKHSYQNDSVTKTAEGVLEKSGTILYIEDNIQNAQLVEEFIESYRPKIHLIISMYGSSAVKLATDHLPGLILLDLDLPDVQGSEVLKNLQADPKTRAIPVVILTADAMPQQVEKLMTSGASDYLTKPLDLRLFLQVVDEWIVGI